LKTLLTILIICFSLTIYGQSKNLNKEVTENHEHHKNEIGIANSPVYFIKEKVFAYGLHFHYVRNIPKTKFGLGFGYERIFDEHKHNTFGLVGTYRPIENVSFNISPGLTFEDENKSAKFALHLETAYEWEIKNFHFGPAFEFAYDPEDFHISLGLHIGYGF
jgi:hypothetical protein